MWHRRCSLATIYRVWVIHDAFHQTPRHNIPYLQAAAVRRELRCTPSSKINKKTRCTLAAPWLVHGTITASSHFGQAALQSYNLILSDGKTRSYPQVQAVP
ncbi:unnamed protein product, partial [Ectocarpus sp. 8 AP-2014]